MVDNEIFGILYLLRKMFDSGSSTGAYPTCKFALEAVFQRFLLGGNHKLVDAIKAFLRDISS